MLLFLEVGCTLLNEELTSEIGNLCAAAALERVDVGGGGSVNCKHYQLDQRKWSHANCCCGGQQLRVSSESLGKGQTFNAKESDKKEGQVRHDQLARSARATLSTGRQTMMNKTAESK